jgi:hypothetical protein
MKKRELSDFFSLGYSSAVVTLVTTHDDIDALLIHANRWHEGLVKEGFKISARLMDTRLVNFLTRLSIEITKKNIASVDGFQALNHPPLPLEDAKEISSRANEVIRAIMAELEDIPVFSIGEKRYSYEKLGDSIETLFGVNVFFLLPEIAQYDFREAGKCILFDRATASAFHCLRGTEARLKQFCEELTGAALVPNATWGDVENNLRAYVPKLDSAILEQITHVRKRYRNQTQHPLLKYDIEEAQDLLNLCIELCNRLNRK